MPLNAIRAVAGLIRNWLNQYMPGHWHILRLNSSYGWPPEQISLRIDALLAGQTLKDDDGWTGDMGLRPVSRMAVCRYIYGLNGNERNER